MEEHQLPGGVRDVVLAADDMSDLHAGVVDDHGEVVGEAAVGALDYEVADDLRREGDRAVDEVVEGDITCRHLEADGRLLPRGEPGLDLARTQAQTATVVLGHLASGQLLLFQSVELLLRAEAGVRASGGQELLHSRLIQAGTLALAVRSERTAHVRALVGLQAQPFEVAHDAGVVLGGGPLEVGVLDAKHHGAAVVPGEQVVVESGAGTPHVQ